MSNKNEKSAAQLRGNNVASTGDEGLRGKGIGVALLVEGAFLAVGSQVLFPACGPNAEGMYMSCHYSQETVSAIGALVAVLAIVYLASKKAGARRGISLVSALAGLLVVAVPTVIVGVCPMPTMHCHLYFLPSSILLGVIIAATGIAGVVLLTVRGGKRHVVASEA